MYMMYPHGGASRGFALKTQDAAKMHSVFAPKHTKAQQNGSLFLLFEKTNQILPISPVVKNQACNDADFLHREPKNSD